MGLWKFLTKPIGAGSTAFAWSEPAFFRLRLRRDLPYRAAVVLAAWCAASGVLCALFAINVNPPGLVLAGALGLVFGLGPAAILLFGLRDHVSGRVSVGKGSIRRRRNYASLTHQWTEWEEWPFEVIGRCAVVASERAGHSFSVLMISDGLTSEVIGLPHSLDLVKLAKYLDARGVPLEKGKAVPARFTRTWLGPPAVAAFGVVGLAVLAGGVVFYATKVGVARLGRPDIQADRQGRERVPRPEQPRGAAAAEVPGNAVGEPPAPEARPAPPPPAPVRPGPLPAGHTELVGGAGGSPFTRKSPDGQPVVGLRYSFGEWSGRQRIGRLEPLFSREQPAGWGQVVVAREGYAVGGLEVSAGDLVDAVRVVFLRVTPGGRLDPTDSYQSDWLGRPGGGPGKTLGGSGARVVGIHGRGAAVLDAVGLILDE